MLQTLVDGGWEQQLGRALFAPANWHQSLSHPLPYSSALLHRMLRVGACIECIAFTLLMNRISGMSAGQETIHWKFSATRKPAAFSALLASVRNGLREEGIEGMPGNSPHVTVSYWAPYKLPLQVILPIAWRIDEILLVETRSDPYRYETLGRWPLRPAPRGIESQLELW